MKTAGENLDDWKWVGEGKGGGIDSVDARWDLFMLVMWWRQILYAGDGGKWGEINGKFQARFSWKWKQLKVGVTRWSGMAEGMKGERMLRGEALSWVCATSGEWESTPRPMGRMKAEVDAKKEEELGETLKEEEEERPVREVPSWSVGPKSSAKRSCNTRCVTLCNAARDPE